MGRELTPITPGGYVPWRPTARSGAPVRVETRTEPHGVGSSASYRRKRRP
ncbi:hypothetical protein BN2537_12041 [Streptomyces venezuelae]|nr:hypothetical protein BN2537_12041 [Streptomyces venezuelae]